MTTLTCVDDAVMAEIAEEMRLRQTDKVILVFSLGSQYDHLIMQKIAKCRVFCLSTDPRSITAADVARINPAGIVLSGGPAAVHTDTIHFDRSILDLSIPVLGICLGFQLWAHYVGCRVVPSEKREFSTLALTLMRSDPLFHNLPSSMPVLQNHADKVVANEGLTVLGRTANCEVAAARYGHLWGVQFHPEVQETEHGQAMFEHFCGSICGIDKRFPVEDVAARKIAELRSILTGSIPLLALSAGSDSSVVAHLAKEALEGTGQKLHALYIKATDRPDDMHFVERFFGDKDWIDLTIIDATDQFLHALARCRSMPRKRKAMRTVYKRVIVAHGKSIGATHILQGTLATDNIESGGGMPGLTKAVIKVHHNTNLRFTTMKEITPLDDCVKDTARDIGRQIGVPEDLLTRHPFPGPGLIVRIEGKITRERLAMAREVDNIWIGELRKAGLYTEVWQAGAVVTQSMHTVSKGDNRGSGPVIALWAVSSVDGFTARKIRFDWDFLEQVEQRICNEVDGVGAVIYRISNKPPSTIEWG